MEIKLLFLFFIFLISKINAQQCIFRKISERLPGATVYNYCREEKSYAEKDGYFMIGVERTGELLFIKESLQTFFNTDYSSIDYGSHLFHVKTTFYFLMKKILFLFALLPFLGLFSQSIMTGKVLNAAEFPVANVLVVHISSGEKTTTDHYGNFSIPAKVGDELRFVEERFERKSMIVSSEDFQHPVNIILQKLPFAIQEVKVKYKLTGNLKEDAKHCAESKKTTKLKEDVSVYLRKESDRSIVVPKAGEFVQPVGQGFFVGGVNDKWDDVDFMEFLIAGLGEDFFLNDLSLQKTEIQSFIFYVFRNFDRKDILHYGSCAPKDLHRFATESEKKVSEYKNSIQNGGRKMKKN